MLVCFSVVVKISMEYKETVAEFDLFSVCRGARWFRMKALALALSAFIRIVDAATFYHSQRVACLSRKIGNQLAITDDCMQMLFAAALLHDIGKLFVPRAILHETRPLTEAQLSLVRSHVVLGAAFVSRIPILQPLASIIRAHHERYDGSGYPDRLSGASIPLEARIIAVADAYDAMTSHRSYQRARSCEESVAEVMRGIESQWDPFVVRAFLDVLWMQNGEKEPRRLS